MHACTVYHVLMLCAEPKGPVTESTSILQHRDRLAADLLPGVTASVPFLIKKNFDFLGVEVAGERKPQGGSSALYAELCFQLLGLFKPSIPSFFFFLTHTLNNFYFIVLCVYMSRHTFWSSSTRSGTAQPLVLPQSQND